jgi:hypothetical protein
MKEEFGGKNSRKRVRKRRTNSDTAPYKVSVKFEIPSSRNLHHHRNFYPGP